MDSGLPQIDRRARLTEAARIVAERLAPVLLVTGDGGRPVGILREESIRLGLAGDVRPDHGIERLVESLPQKLPEAAEAPQIRRALVMAGGRGSRLLPLTEDCPKPLLPVRGEPMLFRILRQLADIGVREVWISVLYLAEQIRAAVGDGRAFGIEAHFLHEEDPLGTAGALGLLPDSTERLLVSNGDLWTSANLTSLAAWHERHGNAVTMATHLFEVHVPFGLAHFEGQRLHRLEEKPTLRLPVNAGFYVFEARIVDQVPRDVPFDMVSWLEHLARQEKVGHFPLVEEWHDVGSLEAYRELGDREIGAPDAGSQRP